MKLVFTKECPVCEKEQEIIVTDGFQPQLRNCSNPNCPTSLVVTVVLDVMLAENSLYCGEIDHYEP